MCTIYLPSAAEFRREPQIPQDWNWGWFVSHYMGAGNSQVFTTEPSAQPSSYTAVMTGFSMGQ